MRNSIFVRRQRKVILAQGQDYLPDTYIATALKNIESLGFTFSATLISRVRTLSIETFTEFYQQLVANLKIMTGAHQNFQPMYPNFPKQVMNEDLSILYLNAIIHYHTLLLPHTEVEERPPLLESPDLKVIELGNVEEFDQMIKQLIGANSSISETDKADIHRVIEHYDDLQTILPDEIPLKENVGFVVGVLLKYRKATFEQIAPYFKTATDVLRLATALSDGDVSLAANTKFRRFKRHERRVLLALLEQCHNLTEDMIRHQDRWVRLGEILHPGDYQDRYPKVYATFDIIRNNKEFPTFGRNVETALKNGELDQAAALLKTRPGEFARRLDHLLRMTTEGQLIVDHFAEVVDSVSTPVLLQVMAHFKQRNQRGELRTFFPKGNVAKLMAVENKLPKLDESNCISVVQVCADALTRRFSTLPALGKVWVDDRLKQYVVPFSQRSASKSLRTIVRGSQVEMPEGGTIRFFTWWKEGFVNEEHTGRVDIDLSAVIYDEEWNYKELIAFTNLRSDGYGSHHSGDITSAPDGACEFIDLEIESILRNGARYVVMSLFSFSHQPYSALPECFAGWMMRTELDSGEIFEPSTVQDKIDLASDTQICIPVILDLVKKKVIWTDLGLKRRLVSPNMAEENQHRVALMGQAMTTLSKPNLYDLFSLHAAARGSVVEGSDQADTIFSVEQGITPFDLEQILAEFII